jgi:hypothetical protein
MCNKYMTTLVLGLVRFYVRWLDIRTRCYNLTFQYLVSYQRNIILKISFFENKIINSIKFINSMIREKI